LCVLWVLSFATPLGCRVTTANTIDATAPHGDGLPDRIIVDGPWPEAPAGDGSDAAQVDSASSDARTDGDATMDAGRADAVPADGESDSNDGGPCNLLERTCPDKQACFPTPFESAPTGGTECAFVGAGGASVPCQSQLECSELTICSAPGQPDSVCRQRCDLDALDCPAGMLCRPLPGYGRTGLCI